MSHYTMRDIQICTDPDTGNHLIYDGEDLLFALPPIADDQERETAITRCLRAFNLGMERGKLRGLSMLQFELRKLLGIEGRD